MSRHESECYFHNKIALQRHGYVFSDEEDGATDIESGYDEPDAHLKPPPIVIPQDKIVVIKAKPPSEKRRKTKNPFGQKKIKEKPTAPISKIITKNFFDALKPSSSEDSDENEEESLLQQTGDRRNSSFEDFQTEIKQDEARNTNNFHNFIADARNENSEIVPNALTLNEDICHGEYDSDSDRPADYSWEIKETKKKKRKRKAKRVNIKKPLISTRIEHERFTLAANGNTDKANRYPRHKAPTEYKIPAKYIDEFLLTIWSANQFSCQTENEYLENDTSWDNISENKIRRSNMLIEQEYENIIGLKEKIEATKIDTKIIETGTSWDNILENKIRCSNMLIEHVCESIIEPKEKIDTIIIKIGTSWDNISRSNKIRCSNMLMEQEYENIIEPKENIYTKITKMSASWDNISENKIHRSDMLIEQEYENIIGLKEKLEVAKIDIKTSSPINLIINEFLKDFDYIGFLNVAVLLIGTYFWTKYNK